MSDETTTEQLAEIEGQAESTPVTGYTPPEGWRVLAVGEALREGDERVQTDESRYATRQVGRSVQAHERYIRRIDTQPQPQPESHTELQAQVAFLKNREVTLGTRLQQEREVTTRLRHELKTVQNQLAAVKAELATKAETSRRLQMELDAAQQVPADSPEIRQLWANLAEVAHDRDTYKHAHELLVQDIDATHQRTKAMTVEAIAEWLVPVQAAIAAADNVAESTRAGWLAEEVIQHLPKIMRSLVGLDSPEDVE